MLLTLEHQTDSPAHRAQQLAKKLLPYRHTDSLIVASSPSSYELATQVASELELSCEKDYCNPLWHPGNPNRTVGSISACNVVLDSQCFTLPSDYIEHQIVRTQHSIVADQDPVSPHNYKDKNVIIVREELNSTDEVVALVEQLKKEEAASVILATPIINREVLTTMEKQVSEVVYLEIQHHTGLWLNPYCF